MTPAQAWGRALTREMEKQGISCSRLAAECGIHAHTVRYWRRGKVVPTPALALPVAEFLMSTRLTDIITEARSKTCQVCDKVFIDTTHQMKALYCTKRCWGTAAARRRRARLAPARAAFVGHRLALYVDTIDRLCRDYCPFVKAGLCPDPDCPPQQAGLSPLPLSKEAAA